MYVVVEVVNDVVVVLVRVVVQYVDDVKTMLTVSTIVELAVVAEALVSMGVDRDATTVWAVPAVVPVLAVSTVEEVVTA